MRKLEKPEESAENVFIECISSIGNEDLKSRLTAAKDLIVEAQTELNDKITQGQVHTILREVVINQNLSAKELENVYSRMLKKDSPGRKFYDKLLCAPSHGVCPLCSHRLVTTLDHYLPKALYPKLSVVPINLIPACTDCNRGKLTNYPRTEDEETLHPYYDNIENVIWLSARVLHTNPPTFQYEVIPPDNWSNLLGNRVKNHFKSLKIDKLYTTLAAEELSQINFRLNFLLVTAGLESVRRYLHDAEETRSHNNINSWQTAMYHAATEDIWFYSGGFKLTNPVVQL